MCVKQAVLFVNINYKSSIVKFVFSIKIGTGKKFL